MWNSQFQMNYTLTALKWVHGFPYDYICDQVFLFMMLLMIFMITNKCVIHNEYSEKQLC